MKKLVVGNWKMNPASYGEAKKMAKAAETSAKRHKNAKVVICPPFTWLTDMSHEKKAGLDYGAQDVFWLDKGAYTGEISPVMLKRSRVKYVIIGHSERRRLGETDADTSRKVKAALQNKLTPILCVGEDAKAHKLGPAAVLLFLKKQLGESLRGVSRFTLQDSRLFVAYEPVWAISTNPGSKSDNPAQAEQVISHIKNILSETFHVSRLKIQVLYGGSVNGQNAEGYLKSQEIDGVLVGGASLNPREFGEIIQLADKVSKNSKKNKKQKTNAHRSS